MKQLSKKEKFRLEKQRIKRNKKIMIYSIIIILSIGFIFWFISSVDKSLEFKNPNVKLSDVPSGKIHWHPKLIIKFDGVKQTIPDHIGLNRHSPTHTHDEGDGTIHVENLNPKSDPETMSLGYFFNLWRQPFNKTCILDKCINVDGGEIKMFVNEKENFEFENYVFKGDDKILIEYNSSIYNKSN